MTEHRERLTEEQEADLRRTIARGYWCGSVIVLPLLAILDAERAKSAALTKALRGWCAAYDELLATGSTKFLGIAADAALRELREPKGEEQ